MKHLFAILFSLSICTFATAQNEVKRTNFSYFEKGRKVFGVELGIAGGYPINSVTELSISKNEKYYGLLIIPSYGKFVETNWVIGGQAILGFNNSRYSYNNGTQTDYNKSKSSDFGLAPFTRYFVPLGKRNVVSIFGQASLPILYSSYYSESSWPGTPRSIKDESELRIIGTIGLGVSLNGRFGSLELNANTTGLYVGFHKYF